MVNGTKAGCQNMVQRTKFVIQKIVQNWLSFFPFNKFEGYGPFTNVGKMNCFDLKKKIS